MPPPTTSGPPQLAEIARLGVRLSVAQSKRGPLLETFNELKTRHSTEYSELNKFQQQIDKSQAAADLARSVHRMSEYQFHIQIVNEKNWTKDRCLLQLEELWKTLEKVGRELRDLEVEIIELKRMLNE